ncbi:DUF4439 domain-containing protein [Leekyejoonella antrihumi]|nr:DUF4439 domain-containing protein [Leekyejoonella antrihumi]
MPQGTSGAHSRRAVLASCALLTAGVLAGCDVRLQRGAPHIPGVPTQSPPADAATLRAMLLRLRGLAARAEGVGHVGGATSSAGHSSAAKPSARASDAVATHALWAARLATIHHQQATRLAAVIATEGISAPPSAPVAATGTLRQLRDLEVGGVGPRALDGVAGVAPENVPMLCSIAATQGAGARMLGAAVSWPSVATPGPAALALLSDVRGCVYALEVIAGRTPLKQRTLIAATLTTMYAARSRLVLAAGSSAPPAPVEYRLPVPVTDAAAARRLAQVMLGRVVATCASQSPSTAGRVSQVGAVVRLWSEATAASWQWGVKPVPFPGLRE